MTMSTGLVTPYLDHVLRPLQGFYIHRHFISHNWYFHHHDHPSSPYRLSLSLITTLSIGDCWWWQSWMLRSPAQDIPDIYWEQAARELDFCTCRKCQVCYLIMLVPWCRNLFTNYGQNCESQFARTAKHVALSLLILMQCQRKWNWSPLWSLPWAKAESQWPWQWKVD